MTEKFVDRHTFHMQRLDSLREFHELFNQRAVIDERAIAIIGAAFLDSMLEDILTCFMVDDDKESKKLLNYDQPMGTFSGRITAAYCLGLICKTVRDDLGIIAKIRNKFAHELRTTFDQHPINVWCGLLGGMNSR